MMKYIKYGLVGEILLNKNSNLLKEVVDIYVEIEFIRMRLGN